MIEIKPIHPKYAKDTWESRNNPAIWKYAKKDAPVPATLDSEAAFYLTMKNDKRNIMFAITEQDTMIGAVTLKKVAYGTAGIGYYILRQNLWNKGIAKCAVKQAIDIAFNGYNLDLVYLWVDPANVASFKLALDLGFYSVGHSLLDPELQRLEMTRTIWKQRSELK